MNRQFLAATGGRPAVSFIDTASGEIFPLPVGVDDSNGFDQAICRDGWVAVRVGHQLVALTDGDLLHPTRLPDCWQLFASNDPETVVITRHFGRSRSDGEPQIVAEVTAAGAIRREVAVTSDSFHGVLGDGRLVGDGLYTWESGSESLSHDGWVLAVVGDLIVMQDHSGALWTLDARTGAKTDIPGVRSGFWTLTSPTSDGRAVLLTDHDFHANQTKVLAVHNDATARLAAAEGIWSTCWTYDGLIVLSAGTHRLLDLEAGSMQTVPLQRNAAPRVDVTGRFNLGQLRATVQPNWRGPIPKPTRDAMLEAQRTTLGPHGPTAVAARIRPVLSQRRLAVAASHLGGEPALPPGATWPRYGDAPMSFLGQFRGDEISAAVPEAALGEVLVSLFVGLEPDGLYPVDIDAATVLVLPCSGLTRARWPSDLDPDLRYPLVPVSIEPLLTLPLQRTDGGSHLLGFAGFIQEPEIPEGLALLAQIDSEAMTGWTFGDGGRLHVWSTVVNGVLHAGSCAVTLDCY